MNRYSKGPSSRGGTSKATPTTLCQRCLKKGHYSYECTASAQALPYTSRPSRTQQLLNSKLVPTLSSEVPRDLLRKKGVADEQLAKAELERGRKRERQSEDREIQMKRLRSASSASVSTISTNLSKSPPPNLSREPDRQKLRSMSLSESPRQQPSSRSPSPPPRRKLSDSEKKRRRESYSSMDSHSPAEVRASRDRGSSRSTRRRYERVSPHIRGRKPTESRSPIRERRQLSNDRQRDRSSLNGTSNLGGFSKERSLSPFSKRLALTQAMNTSR